MKWLWLPGLRIALLRHVDARRLYVVAHDGRLPAQQSDIPVPLPDDPFTGKPFRYEVSRPAVHLRGAAPSAVKQDPTYHVHYEVTFRR